MKMVKVINGDPASFQLGAYHQWGLGEDGDLYYRVGQDDWVGEWKKYAGDVSWKEMRMIVKELGYLVVWT